MTQHLIDYSEIMKLGFEKEFINDKVFLRKYGHQCFYVTKELQNGMIASWDCNTQVVTLSEYDEDHTLKASMTISCLLELEMYLSLFDRKPPNVYELYPEEYRLVP